MNPTDSGLEQVRAEVAACDRLILETLARRLDQDREAVKYKATRSDILDPVPPEKLFQKIELWAKELDLSPTVCREIYEIIIRHVLERRLEIFESQAQNDKAPSK